MQLAKDGGQEKTRECHALNPQGLIPALAVDGDVLTRSRTILEWLGETHPDPPLLLPADAIGRAHVRAFCQAIACEIHPLQNLRVLQYLRAEYG